MRAAGFAAVATSAAFVVGGCTAEQPSSSEGYPGWVVRYDMQPGEEFGTDLRAVVTDPNNPTVQICAYEKKDGGKEQQLGCSTLNILTGKEEITTKGDISVEQLVINGAKRTKLVIVSVSNDSEKSAEIELCSQTTGVEIVDVAAGKFVDFA